MAGHFSHFFDARVGALAGAVETVTARPLAKSGISSGTGVSGVHFKNKTKITVVAHSRRSWAWRLSAFPAFKFRVEAVLDIMDAVGVELEAIAWRDFVKVG